MPAYGEVDVAVTYSPSEFSTAHMKMQLLVSQFNAKPLTCLVTGLSSPGLAKLVTRYYICNILNRALLPSHLRYFLV